MSLPRAAPAFATRPWTTGTTSVGALVGVASTRLKDYIDDLVPGFGDQYAKAAQRGPTRSNFGA